MGRREGRKEIRSRKRKRKEGRTNTCGPSPSPAHEAGELLVRS